MAEEQKEETVRQEVEDKSEGAIQEPGTDIPDQGPETFEDAQDSVVRPPSRPMSAASSSRSLTHRRPSSSSGTTPNGVLTREDSITRKQKQTEPELPKTVEDPEPDSSQTKSPLLTAHRLSTTSLDDVNLEEAQAERSRSSTITSKTSQQPTPKPSLPPRDSTGSNSKLKGFSGSLPSMPWGAPPAIIANTAQSRKISSPFTWLSRASSAPKEVPSPPLAGQHTRRDTASSFATIGSNPELMLSRFEDGQESDGGSMDGSQKLGRNSLRDRFKLLRMREEAGISNVGEEDGTSPGTGSALAGLIGRSAGLGLGIGSPTMLSEEKEGVLGPQISPGSEHPPKSPLNAPVNPNLAPGMASGVSAGPSAMTDPEAPVDWDLWQAVVYEGPAAVARTSPEELNRAIASGIPSAIRGVVWQVLAQSKNEELESVYRDLVIRGTDKERDRLSSSNISIAIANGKLDGTSIQPGATAKDKDSILSSASSTHSDHSTAATSATNGVTSPISSHDNDAAGSAKLHAQLAEEKRKKAKDDTAAIRKLEKTIKRDLGARTSFSKYAASAGLQEGLFGVCKAYALFDEGVGYAQGMSFLAMPLLFNMPEEEAFCLLVRLMNQYHLRELFIHDMPGLHLHLYQFERLLEDFEPALYCHLHRKGVNPQLYATQWFLTLFAYRFPLQLVLRIYDLVLSEGLEGAILKFGIILMQKNAATLLSMTDMVALTTFLKEKIFDVYIDQAPSANSILESGFFGTAGGIDKEVYRADMLVQDACAVKITPEMLKIYTEEWEEKAKIEKAREAELEFLRTTNSTLTNKIRSLEERAEKHDTEHVQVASELVRIKVQNEELKDVNESMTGQITELRKVIEKQPEEVEQMFKGEMDRIMKRNAEVQDENRSLETQMEEMETALVTVKMEYAEISSAHETLKQKWNDLRRAVA